MKIAIIGKGNVGTHLQKAFSGNNIKADLIDSRSFDGLGRNYSVIFLCVPDNSIKPTASRLKDKIQDFEGIVVHTGGSVDMQLLNEYFKNYGVFYPLQTFSKSITISNYSEIPVFIEANGHINENFLKTLASSTFGYVMPLTSEKRKKLHLAAVFVCNFVNACYAMGEDLLRGTEIPFDVLRPLISQTAEKALFHLPDECQTGPAKRGDDEIMKSHASMLSVNPEMLNIYTEFSSYIYNKFNERH